MYLSPLTLYAVLAELVFLCSVSLFYARKIRKLESLLIELQKSTEEKPSENA